MKTLQNILVAIAVLCITALSAQTQTENYVKTTTYQTGVQEGEQSEVLESDKIVSVNYFDGLGRAKQSIAVRAGGQQQNTNIFDWTNDWTVGTGSTGLFNMTGRTVDNKREFGTNPFGEQSLVWRCGNNSNVQTNAGWNSDHFDIDKNVGYMYTVWMKRTGTGSATAYHGIWNVDFTWGGSAGNPYFVTKKLPNANTWYLVVGMIHPHTYAGGSPTVSGIYDINGNKVANGTDFKWKSNTTSTRLRDFYYDANATNSYAYYWNPRITIVDNNSQPISQIIEASTPKDIITHYEYDNYGRQAKEYLPYASEETQNGDIYTNPLAELNAFYNTTKYQNTPNPYSETIFEASPLNRPLKQAAPGADWQASVTGDDHTIKLDRTLNSDTDDVVYFKVNFTDGDTEKPTLEKVGDYPENELFVTITKDENWTESDQNDHTTKEYTDKLGRVILKRTFNNNTPHDTYYVYDDFGNLTFVLPPKITVNDGVSATELSELGYQYKYDHRNRLVEKKIPGKGPEYIVYNKLDQPVMTQDAVQRAKKEWLFTKYDALGRVAFTGLHINPSFTSRTTMQANADTRSTNWVNKSNNSITIAGTPIYYSNDAIPTGIHKIYTINYYDNYTFDRDGMNKPASVYGIATSNTTKGLATGSKVRVLGTDQWITTVMAYDIKGQVIWTGSRNDYLNTTDKIENELDFTGKPIQVKTTHTKGSNAAIVTTDTFTYDHMGRLLTQKQQIGTHPQELIVQNNYDDLGQLENKKVGNAEQAPLQIIDYKYNVRGWLTDINDVANIGDDLFTFKINYNNTQISGSTALYNGNISETHWRTANDQTLRNYKYSYDPLNRITGAIINDNRYNLSNVTYDKMGNLMTLKRGGAIVANADYNNTSHFGVMDNLNYSYHNGGNKLKAVAETIVQPFGFTKNTTTDTDYTYDVNGNMTLDRNKGITSVLYNHHNMPTDIVVNNAEHNGSIQYIYDANGIKLKKIATDNGNGTTTEYNGDYIYENGILKFINHAQGYAEPNDNNGFDYVYHYKDYWGNTRISYSDGDKDGKIDIVRNDVDIDGDGDLAHEIRREQNYYPFGLEHKGYNNTLRGVKNNLKTYQNQEFTEDLGLNTFEWRYRVSDPSIGRFWQIDPLAEDYTYNSTYAFQENKLGLGFELEGLEVYYGAHYSAFGDGKKDKPIPPAQLKRESIAAAKHLGTSVVVSVTAVTPGPEDIVIGGMLATKFGGAVMKLFTKLFSKSDKATDTAKTLAKNKEVGKEGEKIATESLKKEFGGDEVLEQVTGKFEDGSRTVMDNVVVDSKTGNVKMVNETKTGNATLTNQQKRLHQNGESVELVGKKSGDAKGQVISSENTTMRTSRVDTNTKEIKTGS